MTYFKDLSEYEYDLRFARPGTRNIGWLGHGHEFPTKPPSDDLLESLWIFCSISVALARGGHDCEFCPSGSAYIAKWNGQQLLQSCAEIRVFSEQGRIYAAPNLIFHYVQVHHYHPPEEFLEALHNGPRPPHRNYYESLEKLGLTWHPTSDGSGMRGPFKKRAKTVCESGEQRNSEPT